MILSESKPLFKDILRGRSRQNYRKIPIGCQNQSSRRGFASPVLSHHRAYRSVHSGSLVFRNLQIIPLSVYDVVGVFSNPPTIGHLYIFSLFRRYLLQLPLFSRLSVHQFVFGYFHFLPLLRLVPFRVMLFSYGTMASADFSPFVVTTASYFVSTVDETSPGTNTLLSLHISATSTLYSSVQLLVFDVFCHLAPIHSLMWFLFVRPEVCLHLLSDSTSRWTSLVFGCILPTVGRIRVSHPLETCAVKRTQKKRRWNRSSLVWLKRLAWRKSKCKIFSVIVIASAITVVRVRSCASLNLLSSYVARSPAPLCPISYRCVSTFFSVSSYCKSELSYNGTSSLNYNTFH